MSIQGGIVATGRRERQGTSVTPSDTRKTRHAVIAAYLRGLVAGASAGERLPSDAELCRRFGVSRMTARGAVEQLAAEGLLYRRRGLGTFVAARRVPRLLGSPLSFTESMRRRGLTASSRIIEVSKGRPDPEDVEALGLNGDDQVVILERLRLADGVPMALERAVIAPDLSALLDADLEGISLHGTMERLGRIPTRAQARVTARPADDRELELLQLDPPGVLLCERRVITDQNDAPLEHTETRYAAERYVFEAVLYRDDHDVMR
jgi:GntR family transcriptional regulator